MAQKAELSVSNIAWSSLKPDEARGAYSALERLSVARIDVAPTVAFPQIKEEGVRSVGAMETAEFKKTLAEYGLSVAGMQSLTHGRPENIFNSDKQSLLALREHFAAIFDLGQALGTRTLVFGSPRMRTTGDLTPAEIEERAAEFITNLDQLAGDAGVLLGIEPVSLSYTEGEPVFGETGEDLVNFIAEMNRKHGTKNTRFVPDTFAMHDGNDLPIATLKRAAKLGVLAPHMQIAEAALAAPNDESPIAHDVFDTAFDNQLPALQKEGESPVIAIEMTRKDEDQEPLEVSIQRAISTVRRVYRQSL